ncbi:MAG TPA: hypothetical protein VHR39_08355, partial [Propionibacteriaceae bacterium]|nr:hypothetical protein [Propionibacteriaceae bacterium]
IRRRNGVAPRKVRAARTKVINTLVEPLGNKLINVRDRALILIGFAGAPPSEFIVPEGASCRSGGGRCQEATSSLLWTISPARISKSTPATACSSPKRLAIACTDTDRAHFAGWISNSASAAVTASPIGPESGSFAHCNSRDPTIGGRERAKIDSLRITAPLHH